MEARFSSRDREFMQIAIDEARIAFNDGNWPVGAVLVVDNKLVAQERNHKGLRRDRISHAEMLLFINHSQEIYTWNTVENKKVELFTTCEPCLMCFGAAVIHRLDRIVVACRDPRGNMRSIRPEPIGEYYVRHWPSLEFGLLYDEAYQLLKDFYKGRDDAESKEAAHLFESMSSEANHGNSE